MPGARTCRVIEGTEWGRTPFDGYHFCDVQPQSSGGKPVINQHEFRENGFFA